MIKLNPTTYKQEVKTDKRDELFVEIGDSKDLSKFQPQMKICRWGNGDGTNECNVSIRLIEDKDELKETATIIEEAGKIKHIKTKRECHFYNLPISEEHIEGASEFEVILKSDPRKKKGEDYTIEFSLEDKDAEYTLQPALTPEEIAEGATRPENIEGSYAIYAKTPKTNWTGGKEYKCGKIGHIYRPKIIDSAGTEVWGELHIENGILTVTIPQDFLDKAVYPVRHAAGLTFGYATKGGSTYDWGLDNNMFGYRFTLPEDGTISSVSLYVYKTSSTYFRWKGVIVKVSDKTIVTNGAGNQTNHNLDNYDNWSVSSFASPPAIVAAYYFISWVGRSYSTGNTTLYYDNGTGNYQFVDSSNDLGTPTNPTDMNLSYSSKYSIYATYTAGGGGSPVQPNHLFSLMGCGN